MKKRTLIIILILAGLLLVFGIFYFITQIQENKISKLESKIDLLKEETIPLRFKILKKENGYINFALKLYDSDDNEIIRKEFQLKGTQLSFDFVVLPVNDKYLAFPYKIFTDEIAPENGELLYDLYDKNGFPQIYNTANIDKDVYASLTSIFELLKTNNTDELDGIFGSMVQDVKKYNEFTEYQIYKVVIHTKGGIEIIED